MTDPLCRAPSQEQTVNAKASGRRDLAIALLLAAGALIVYIKTLCPTIYTDDCGEITTAVATGGVMHPPGYPLYSLIGGAFVRLIPWGEPAWRLGLLSCLSAAGAVALTYGLCRQLGAGRAWAALAALCLAFSYTLWQQATKVETYALNALFVALVTNLAIAHARSRRRSAFIWLCAALGLALTNHLTVLWLIPAVAWIVWPTLLADPRPARTLATGLGLCLLALCLYGYEAYAAITHPGGQIWGDPSTPARFWLQVTAARYHDYLSNQTAAQVLQRDFIFVPSWLWRNLGAALLPALAGLFFLWRTAERRVAQGLLIGIAGYLIGNTLYGIDNIFEYYTPVVLLFCALAGAGVDRLVAGMLTKATEAGAPKLAAMAFVAGALILAGLPLAGNFRLCDRSHAFFVRDLALDSLQNLPQNAVVVASSDNRIFPLWYMQDVLGVRRDVLILPRDFLWDMDTEAGRQTNLWYLEKLAARDPQIHPEELIARCRADQRYAQSDGPIWQIAREKLAAGRPIYVSEVLNVDLVKSPGGSPIFAWIGLPVSPAPEGLLYRLVPPGQMPSPAEQLATNRAIARQLHITAVPPDTLVGEPDGAFSNQAYARCLAQIGQMLLDQKQYPAACRQLQAASALDPSNAGYQRALRAASSQVAQSREVLNSPP